MSTVWFPASNNKPQSQNDIDMIFAEAVKTMPESCSCYKAHYVYKTWIWKLKTQFHTTRRMNTLFILSDKWHNMPKGKYLLRFQNRTCFCYPFEMVKYKVKSSEDEEIVFRSRFAEVLCWQTFSNFQHHPSEADLHSADLLICLGHKNDKVHNVQPWQPCTK